MFSNVWMFVMQKEMSCINTIWPIFTGPILMLFSETMVSLSPLMNIVGIFKPVRRVVNWGSKNLWSRDNRQYGRGEEGNIFERFKKLK